MSMKYKPVFTYKESRDPKGQPDISKNSTGGYSDSRKASTYNFGPFVTLEIFDSGAATLRLGSSIVLTFAIDTTSGEIKSPKVNSKALAKFIKAIEWLS